MNQNFAVPVDPIEPEAPKKKTNTVLIVVVVLVVLCCCCLGALGLAWAFGDQVVQTLSAAGY